MLAALLTGGAQLLPGGGRVPSLGGGVNLDFLRNALEQNMVITRSQYLLKDNSGGYYGYGGDSIFGEAFDVAIKCGQALVTYNTTLTPWVADSKFSSYSNSSEYSPVLSTVKVSPVGERLSYEPYWYELSSIRQRTERNCRENVITILNDTTAYGALPYFDAEGEHLRGFIVWVAPDGLGFGSAHGRVKLSFTSPELTFTNGVSQKIDDPSNNSAISAFYIIPRTQANGLIQLTLCGVVYKDNNGDYLVGLIDNPSGLRYGSGITPINTETVAPSQIDPSVIQDI